jgi:hypothetical protein
MMGESGDAAVRRVGSCESCEDKSVERKKDLRRVLGEWNSKANAMD